MKKKILTILLSSAMIFSMGISTVSAAAADDTAATESTVVSRTDGVTDTTSGKVRGFIDDGTYTFRGIPYAKADRFETVSYTHLDVYKRQDLFRLHICL